MGSLSNGLLGKRYITPQLWSVRTIMITEHHRFSLKLISGISIQYRSMERRLHIYTRTTVAMHEKSWRQKMHIYYSYILSSLTAIIL